MKIFTVVQFATKGSPYLRSVMNLTTARLLYLSGTSSVIVIVGVITSRAVVQGSFGMSFTSQSCSPSRLHLIQVLMLHMNSAQFVTHMILANILDFGSNGTMTTKRNITLA
jgi:hypothetical protein